MICCDGELAGSDVGLYGVLKVRILVLKVSPSPDLAPMAGLRSLKALTCLLWW